MPYKLTRPAANFDSGDGLAQLEHFQMAYVTNDIDKARNIYQKQLGVREFAVLEGEMNGGGHIRAEFAWVGTLMYELIQASGPGSEIFSGHLPQTDDFVIKHHHLGFLVQNQGQWDAVIAQAEQNGMEILNRNTNPLVEVCFLEMPAAGHYLEYLFATEAGISFFENVPRN